jgi:uncharacterized Zn finger protein (UPF0148 family)
VADQKALGFEVVQGRVYCPTHAKEYRQKAIMLQHVRELNREVTQEKVNEATAKFDLELKGQEYERELRERERRVQEESTVPTTAEKSQRSLVPLQHTQTLDSEEVANE